MTRVWLWILIGNWKLRKRFLIKTRWWLRRRYERREKLEKPRKNGEKQIFLQRNWNILRSAIFTMLLIWNCAKYFFGKKIVTQHKRWVIKHIAMLSGNTLLAFESVVGSIQSHLSPWTPNPSEKRPRRKKALIRERGATMAKLFFETKVFRYPRLQIDSFFLRRFLILRSFNRQ